MHRLEQDKPTHTFLTQIKRKGQKINKSVSFYSQRLRPSRPTSSALFYSFRTQGHSAFHVRRPAASSYSKREETPTRKDGCLVRRKTQYVFPSFGFNALARVLLWGFDGFGMKLIFLLKILILPWKKTFFSFFKSWGISYQIFLFLARRA